MRGTVGKPGAHAAGETFEIVGALPETEIRIDEEKGGRASPSLPIDSSPEFDTPGSGFRHRLLKRQRRGMLPGAALKD